MYDIKNNPKAFWQYNNSRLNTKAVIGDLVDQSGTPQSPDSAKADILNAYFCSVFTTEDQSIPEHRDAARVQNWPIIEISTTQKILLFIIFWKKNVWSIQKRFVALSFS